MLRTVFGSAEINASAAKGRKSRTFRSPTFSPCCNRCSIGLLHCPCPGSHHHNHPFGIGSADVVEQVVAPAGALGKAIHHVLHDGRTRPVERIDGLAGLEEYVGILRRAAQQRVIGRQCPLPMLADQSVIDQPTQIVIAQAARSCSLRGKCGSRQRNAGRGCVIRARPPAQSGRNRPLPVRNSSRASQSPWRARP